MKPLMVALLAGCLSAAGASPPRQRAPLAPFFNAGAFAGLVQLRAEAEGSATLDFELDDPAGRPQRFRSCQQARTTLEAAVAPAQIALLRLLQLNCTAWERFQSSQPASKTHFPPKLSRHEVAAWPAAAVPLLNAADGVRRAGKQLGRYDTSARVTIRPDGSAVVRTQGDEVQFVIMARADFDGDGVEDLLLRADWSANGAAGQASDLILLGKRSDRARAVILWRP